jgi:hypothetical protein
MSAYREIEMSSFGGGRLPCGRTQARREDVLTLSVQDRDRLSMLRQIHEEVVTAAEAARRLGLSARQFRRLRRRWEAEGDGAVIHRARGRPPNSQVSISIRQRALEMARDPLYEDFGPTLLAEHLERDSAGGRVHSSTLRLWLIAEGLWQPDHRRRRHRKRRPRRRACGELVLMDSSEHDWLEGRGADELSLVAMLDDATSELYAVFYPRDTGLANRQVIAGYLRRYGRMGALYADRAGHFGNWRRSSGARKAEEHAEPVMTNSIIRRGLSELEVELILALSPQAKGRVERLFGTLQDRLIKEMRVAAIASLHDANVFLQEVFIPFWNARFTVAAAEPQDAHRPLPAGVDLNILFAEAETRVLREDFTFQYRSRVLQIEAADADGLRPKQRVTIESRLDGSVRYRCGKRYVTPVLFVPPPPVPVTEKRPRTPPAPRPLPANHPWRKQPFLVGRALHGEA